MSATEAAALAELRRELEAETVRAVEAERTKLLAQAERERRGLETALRQAAADEQARLRAELSAAAPPPAPPAPAAERVRDREQRVRSQSVSPRPNRGKRSVGESQALQARVTELEARLVAERRRAATAADAMAAELEHARAKWQAAVAKIAMLQSAATASAERSAELRRQLETADAPPPLPPPAAEQPPDQREEVAALRAQVDVLERELQSRDAAIAAAERRAAASTTTTTGQQQRPVERRQRATMPAGGAEVAEVVAAAEASMAQLQLRVERLLGGLTVRVAAASRRVDAECRRDAQRRRARRLRAEQRRNDQRARRPQPAVLRGLRAGQCCQLLACVVSGHAVSAANGLYRCVGADAFAFESTARGRLWRDGEAAWVLRFGEAEARAAPGGPRPPAQGWPGEHMRVGVLHSADCEADDANVGAVIRRAPTASVVEGEAGCSCSAAGPGSPDSPDSPVLCALCTRQLTEAMAAGLPAFKR